MKLFFSYITHFTSVLIHKLWLFLFLLKFSVKLIIRGIKHDFSKFSLIESKGFINIVHNLKKSEYGSQEYKRDLNKIDKSIKHHYRLNSHHPEYYKNGIGDMDLLDIIEMYYDWKAASRRHKKVNFKKSLNICERRFLISSQLYKIFVNSLNK